MPETLTQNTLNQLYTQASDYAHRFSATSTGWATTASTPGGGNGGAGGYTYVYQTPMVEFGFNPGDSKEGISPQLYFKYVKKKFGVLEGIKVNSRLEKIKKAVAKAKENGQDLLAEKFLASVGVEVRESTIFAKGITKYVERDVVNKYKNKIRGGHISDTMFKSYTRVIPEDVLAKKKVVEDVFDDFVIYHYWNESAQKDVKNMSPDEKAKMRDPILFGIIKETNKLYFIADWEDEYCDLTFDELVDVVGKQEITKEVNLN